MIEVFKILNGFYDASVTPTLLRNCDTRTRGNDLKLMHNRSRLDIKKILIFKPYSGLVEYVTKLGCTFRKCQQF